MAAGVSQCGNHWIFIYKTPTKREPNPKRNMFAFQKHVYVIYFSDEVLGVEIPNGGSYAWWQSPALVA